MCKNADNPCPGCKKHKTGDVRWMFFTEEEQLLPEPRNRADAPRAEATTHR